MRAWGVKEASTPFYTSFSVYAGSHQDPQGRLLALVARRVTIKMGRFGLVFGFGGRFFVKSGRSRDAPGVPGLKSLRLLSNFTPGGYWFSQGHPPFPSTAVVEFFG